MKDAVVFNLFKRLYIDLTRLLDIPNYDGYSAGVGVKNTRLLKNIYG